MVKSKPTRKFQFSDECPQFFKIYFPDQSSQRLRIPPAFVKEFSGVLPNRSVITSPSKSWAVDVNWVGHNLYFQKGWHDFVEGNDLELGDFLIFYYDGDSEFYVKLYGKDGCKKIPTEKTQKTFAVQENQTCKHKKCKQPRCENSGNGINKRTLRPRVPVAIEEPDKDCKDAGNIVSSHPFFKVALTPSYVANGPLNVPFSFFKSNVDLGRKSVLLRVSDKCWPVTLVTYPDGMAKFSQGWYSFVRECALQVEDVCVFELIEREEYPEFNVKIYGKDGCLKVPTEKTEKSLEVQEKQTFKHTRQFKQLRCEGSGNGVTKMTSRPKVPMAIEEHGKDISNFVSAHPFFKVTVTPSFLASGLLGIPPSFHRKYLNKGIKSVFLWVSDKLWPVKFILSGCRVARFSQGWDSFAREYALQVGDICVFELIVRNEFVLKVLIFRCLEK